MYILVCSDYVQELERQFAKLREEFPHLLKGRGIDKGRPNVPDWRLAITRQGNTGEITGSVVSTSIECMNITSYSKVSYDSRYSRNPLYSSADHLQLAGNSNYGNKCRPIIYYLARCRHIIQINPN